MTGRNTKEMLEKSIKKVEKWVEEHNYKSYEPFDGLSSYLRSLTFGNLFLDRILLQLIRQSPINLRPILGVKPQESTKGRGYMAWGYLTLYRATGQEEYKEKAIKTLEWLMQNKSPKFKKFSWANHFDFASRGGRYTKHESIIVWTSLIGQAFLDAYEILKDEKYLKTAVSVCEWIMNVPREQTNSGVCLSYLANTQSAIHNSNMLGAAMLARTVKFTGDQTLLQVAKDAMEYSCSRQLSNGAWYYGEQENNHWIDNFHTGYNLDSLKCYIESTNDRTYENNLRKGFDFFKNNFFESLANFSEYDKSAIELAKKVAKWTIDNMQDKKGYFYYRQYPIGIKAKTPMLHWAQATTYKALSLLLLKIGNYEK